MIKFLFDVLFGNNPQQMPKDIFDDFIKEHPEFAGNRDKFADYLVDNCGSTYGEAYSALPEKYFKSSA